MARCSGTIKNLCTEKGYGFINPDGGGRPVFCHYKMCPELERAKPGDVVKYDHYWEWTDDDGRVIKNFAWNMELDCAVVIQTVWDESTRVIHRGDPGWQRPNKDRYC